MLKVLVPTRWAAEGLSFRRGETEFYHWPRWFMSFSNFLGILCDTGRATSGAAAIYILFTLYYYYFYAFYNNINISMGFCRVDSAVRTT